MDSNLLSGHDWETRRPIVPSAISPKLIQKFEPKAEALKKPDMPRKGSETVSRKYFSSAGSIPSARPQPQMPAKPAVSHEWKPIDFSRGQILRNVSNTRNTRFQMDKQLRGIFNKSSTRSKVINAFAGKITGSGKLSLRDAKQATYQLRKEGFTQSEINRVRKSMNF